ncbi:hypothetical protein FB599_2280 [Herbaspirillum sp. SJZ130]|nr:hypothetical protein FB599_2280 [Herbaspirillum sp. SJZ130]TQK12385.1 hypothetical protein FB598_2340 [Herbaspirillum sp. SJZ106]
MPRHGGPMKKGGHWPPLHSDMAYQAGSGGIARPLFVQALVSMMLPIFLKPAEMSSPTVLAADFTVSTVVS